MNTGQFFTQFELPADADALALASGLAYVADGTSGLQVVNYLAFDQAGQSPSILVDPVKGDLDPTTPGVQLLEGSDLTLSAHITDDVQVRNVELLVNGVVVRNLVSYPYDLSTTLPLLASGVKQAVVQIRATDTGGNVGLSDPIEIDLVPDAILPAIAALDPPDGSLQPLSFHTITVEFSKEMDTSTVTADNFELIGPSGMVAPVSVRTYERGAAFQFDYPALQGDYQFVIHAGQVTDRVGNALGNVDIVRSFQVGTIMHQPTIRWINPAGGFWDDPANWDAGRLPDQNDDVLIDVPGNVTITFRDPNAGAFPPQPVFTAAIRSLVSNDAFSIVGGHLNVTETVQVNNDFTLGGPDSFDPDAIATLHATILSGTGGQGITLAGAGQVARLDDCIIQTDVSLPADDSVLRLSNDQLDHMRHVNIRFARLGQGRLGEFDGTGITLDTDAAGYGWFVDPTPLANEEFKPATNHVFAAWARSPAAGHMDLLTVLLHELGHAVGMPDLNGNDGGLALMAESLAPGMRRLP
jgi:hypothetical protein